MLIFITCGPAFEPVDGVRRITNFATGEIGAVLARTFVDAGHAVICFRGEGATFPAPEDVEVRSFGTNASLAEGLRGLGSQPGMILHAAALCDFEIASIESAAGEQARRDGKLGSAETLRLTLRPAEKLLPHFREWFPGARIIGWKYELEGGRDEALAKAADQIVACRSDACVVNGAAYGEGFGVLAPDGSLCHFSSKSALAEHLAFK